MSDSKYGEYADEIRGLLLVAGLKVEDENVAQLLQDLILFTRDKVGASRQETIIDWLSAKRQTGGDQISVEVQEDMLAVFDQKVIEARMDGAEILIEDIEQNHDDFGLTKKKAPKVVELLRERFDVPKKIPVEQ